MSDHPLLAGSASRQDHAESARGRVFNQPRSTRTGPFVEPTRGSQQEIELGLVDELRMFRNPIVVGGGTPFLPPVTEDVRLDLVETRTFGSRVIYERYGRARDESD